MRTQRTIALWSILLALLAGGCDLFTDEPTFIDVSGVVVAADTGEPIGGLNVILSRTQGLQQTTVTSTKTGSDGRFRVFHNSYTAQFGYDLAVNAFPNNDSYIGRLIVIKGGNRDLGRIELEPAHLIGAAE